MVPVQNYYMFHQLALHSHYFPGFIRQSAPCSEHCSIQIQAKWEFLGFYNANWHLYICFFYSSRQSIATSDYTDATRRCIRPYLLTVTRATFLIIHYGEFGSIRFVLEKSRCNWDSTISAVIPWIWAKSMLQISTLCIFVILILCVQRLVATNVGSHMHFFMLTHRVAKLRHRRNSNWLYARLTYIDAYRIRSKSTWNFWPQYLNLTLSQWDITGSLS